MAACYCPPNWLGKVRNAEQGSSSENLQVTTIYIPSENSKQGQNKPVLTDCYHAHCHWQRIGTDTNHDLDSVL